MLPEVEQYFRIEKLPHLWCPGCGNGIIVHSLVNAIANLGLDQNRTVIVSGIGCSSRASAYLDFDTLHTTHGRALAFATGIKLAKPELSVFVLMGDGDCTAIGGNHFIHAARRNIDLTTIVFNNNIFGMTGGQHSPLTPSKKRVTTAFYGNLERPFNLAELARGAGATYVARATTYHTSLMTKLIMQAHLNRGFSVVEVITACPTAYGRYNKLGSPADMLRAQRDNAVNIKDIEDSAVPDDKYIIGELYRTEKPEFIEIYLTAVKQLQKKGGQ
ncbi:MAG: 2-oxoacid:ferredoxin oxidoreductase subunit beta [Desulfotomaculum sp.]|nr:2-oxoacid:ferredoxin oxidoreductase subunit beta [Desulfotomaculum sp.]